MEGLQLIARGLALLVKDALLEDLQGGIAFQPAMLSASEAAAYIGVGKTKFYELVADFNIPKYNVGGNPRYKRAELDRLLARAPRWQD